MRTMSKYRKLRSVEQSQKYGRIGEIKKCKIWSSKEIFDEFTDKIIVRTYDSRSEPLKNQ